MLFKVLQLIIKYSILPLKFIIVTYILLPLKRILNIQNILLIIIFGIWMLYLIPILFAQYNPITYDQTGKYFDNSYHIIHYFLLSFICLSIPFIAKINLLFRMLSFVIGSWSFVSLWVEIKNLKTPYEVLNNPFYLEDPLKVTIFCLSLAIMTIYREKIWKTLKDD